MNVAVLIPALVCAAVVAGLALCFRDLARAESALPVTARWINELSTDRYRPMMRLLDSSDIDFLRSQPGFTTQMESRLRAQRCQIFRGYLRCLQLDVKRVATALKFLMAQAERDRPDLAAALLQHQLQFATSMLTVRCRLLLYQWGIGHVDVTSLLQVFDVMRMELNSLVPAETQLLA
jgi:hypothetical protein